MNPSFLIRFLKRIQQKPYFLTRLLVILLAINLNLAADAYAGSLPLPAATSIDSLKQVMTKKLTPQDQINTLFELGKAYYHNSELENALKTDYQLLELIGRHGTKADSAKCLRLIGLAYMQQSWYDKALENLMQSQQLYGEAGDSVMQAKTIMNVGIVHDYMNNFPMSLSYYNKAYDFFKRNHNESGMADCGLNMAIILTRQKNYEPAIDKLLTAAGIYLKAGNHSYLAAAYINLGLTYKKMGRMDDAITYHDKAYEIWKKQDDQYHICYYYLNMGEIMLDLKKPEAAYRYLAEAESRAKKLGSKNLLSKAYEFLSDYNAATRNFGQAYSYLVKSKQINDSILNAETTEKVSQIQYQYEIAKREAENEHLVKANLDNELRLSKKNLVLYILSAILILIAVLVFLLVNQNRIKLKANLKLEAQNDLIQRQRDELINLNASKDKFLSILAHDIKNPLSSIFGISEIMVNDYDTLTPAEKKVFTQDIHTLSVNLFEIINTLLTWSTSQSGMIAYRPVDFGIAALATKSVHNLQTVAKQKDIRLIIESDNELKVSADENMIYSVLNNLINNAIKFSFPGTSIRIKTSQLDGHVHIAVVDSGMGLSPENQAKLFCYDQHFLCKGTAGETGTGLGLILCKDFVEKNGGTLKVESEIDKGSTFVFTLPVAKSLT